jgi:hypothetical protein
VQNPLAHIDIDTAPFEQAFGTAFEVVTDTFGDVTDTLGDRIASDVLPRARAGAEHTQTFVRTRTRVSMAALAGVALVIGLLVIVKRKRRDDTTDEADTDDRRGPRSVA